MTMTKKLNWRLKSLPTASEIASLVEQKVITAKEAKDMLFKDEHTTKDSQDEEVEALREQIEFYQETIEKLIDKLNNTGSTWVYTHAYEPEYPTRYWLRESGATYSMSVSDQSVSISATNA